jgi:endonuclease YncB( thermonuclease family)
VALVLLLAGAAWLAARLDPLPPRFTSHNARASDGDSFWLGSDRVRLLGIDAPELDQICWQADGAEWACGRAARNEMVELLARGTVTCQPEGNDKYGRTLAHCTTGGRDIGAAMVLAGLALAKDEYGAQESEARSTQRGLWQGRFTEPKAWRDQGPQNDPGPDALEQVWTWLRELTGARALR